MIRKAYGASSASAGPGSTRPSPPKLRQELPESLKDTAGSAPAGGQWIVEVDSPQAIQSLIETDPFWPTGLRKSVRVLELTQAFADGKRQI